MKLKFAPQENVLFNGQEYKVKAVRKEFATKKIFYQLKDGPQVEESLLKRVGKTPQRTIDPELVLLREEYAVATGKPVSVAKKNDIVWMKKKIAEVTTTSSGVTTPPAADTPAIPPTDEEKVAVLRELDEDGWLSFLASQELDYDIADYETFDDLLDAVCEELGIDNPPEE